MRPLVDVMLANDTNGLTFSRFDDRYDWLDKDLDDALTACTDAVALPSRRKMCQYALGNTYWTSCDTGTSGCAMGKIEQELGRGNDVAYRLQDLLSRTE